MEDFRIEVSSDLDYEGLVIDIIYLDGLLAKLNCDQGIENAKIFIYQNEQEKPIWELNYSSFQHVLSKAFQKLKEVNSLEN